MVKEDFFSFDSLKQCIVL